MKIKVSAGIIGADSYVIRKPVLGSDIKTES